MANVNEIDDKLDLDGAVNPSPIREVADLNAPETKTETVDSNNTTSVDENAKPIEANKVEQTETIVPPSTGETTAYKLEQGIVVELEDAKYTVDKDLNLVDDKGVIFKKADEVEAYLKEFEASTDTKEDTSIDYIKKQIGIDIVDDKNQPIEFENSPEGISTYVKAVIESKEVEIQTKAIDDLIATYPIVEDVINYITANGSIDGFSENKDYTKIDVSKDNVAQQEQLIRESFKLKGMTKNVDSYVAYLKDSGALFDTAVSELEDIREYNRTKSAELAEQANAKQAEYEKQVGEYWSEVNGIISSGVIADRAIPEKIVIKRNGVTKTVTRSDYFDYLSKPVTKDGLSQRQVDLNNKDKSVALHQELMLAYLDFTGGDISSIVDMEINKEKVRTLKFNKNTSSKTVRFSKPNATGDIADIIDTSL